jgi:hypothetical protein
LAQAPSAYTAVQEKSKYSGLHAPATSFILDQEVAGIWRPLAVSGRTQHSRQVALQRDLQLVALRFEQDGLDQRTNGFHGVRAALLFSNAEQRLPTFSR